MADTDLSELKRRLRAEGFEIYRTQEGYVSLAERVRANLILDSGLAAGAEPNLRVRVCLRTQNSHFPGQTEGAVLTHAHDLARPFLERGYEEEGVRSLELADPGDSTRVLDTAHEVTLRRDTSDILALVAELRWALTQTRASATD